MHRNVAHLIGAVDRYVVRLQAHHIPIYRTDQMGDITVHLS